MAGVTTPQMTAAVSNAGGLGMYPLAAGLPDVAQLPGVLADIRSRLANPATPFGVNLFVPPPTEGRAPRLSEDEAAAVEEWAAWYRAAAEAHGLETRVTAAAAPPDPGREWESFQRHVEVLVQERVPLLSFHFGLPDAASARLIRGAGLLTAACATNVREARAAEAAGVDFVVAQGAEAGGHRGTFYGEDPQSGLVGTLPLIAAVRAAVALPVIAAGGIMDGGGIAAALSAGAAGAWLGTAFLSTPEALIPQWQRRALAEAAAGGRGGTTAVTQAFTGKAARGLTNRLTRELAGVEGRLPGLFGLANTRVFLMEARGAGAADVAMTLCGQGHGRVREMGCGQLLAELEAEADAAVARLMAGCGTA